MVKKIAYTKNSVFTDRHLLECCICHENDRDKLLVEDIGIAVGVSGDNYSFCYKCWNSKNLGSRILKLIEMYPAMKIKDESLDIEEVE